MVELISKLRKGDEVTPKAVNMENSRSNFYRWISFVDDVEKICDKYIKIAQKKMKKER